MRSMCSEVTHGVVWMNVASEKEKDDKMPMDHSNEQISNRIGTWRAAFCASCTKAQKEDGVVVIKEGGQLAITVRHGIST